MRAGAAQEAFESFGVLIHIKDVRGAGSSQGEHAAFKGHLEFLGARRTVEAAHDVIQSWPLLIEHRCVPLAHVPRRSSTEQSPSIAPGDLRKPQPRTRFVRVMTLRSQCVVVHLGDHIDQAGRADVTECSNASDHQGGWRYQLDGVGIQQRGPDEPDVSGKRHVAVHALWAGRDDDLQLPSSRLHSNPLPPGPIATSGTPRLLAHALSVPVGSDTTAPSEARARGAHFA